MKRLLILFCAVCIAAVLLCGCNNKAVEDAGDAMETFASEVRDNVNSMIDNATVSDGDGYIGDNDRMTEPPADTFYDSTETEGMTSADDGMTGEDGGVFDDEINDEPTDNSDFI